MAIDYANDLDAKDNFATSYLDNVTRPGKQIQERFVTTHDQLILGINQRGRITPMIVGGQAVLYAISQTGARTEDGFAPENFIQDSDFPESTITNWIFTTVDHGKQLPAMPFNQIFPHTVQAVPRNCPACHPRQGGSTAPESELVDKATGIGNGLRRGLRLAPGDPSARISTARIYGDASRPDETDLIVDNPLNYDGGPLSKLRFGFRELNIRRESLRVFADLNGDEPMDFIDFKTGVRPEDGALLDINLDEFIDLEFSTGGATYNTLDTAPTLPASNDFRVHEVIQKRPTTHLYAKPLDARAIERMLKTGIEPQVRKHEASD
jgi:hypothetical protein